MKTILIILSKRDRADGRRLDSFSNGKCEVMFMTSHGSANNLRGRSVEQVIYGDGLSEEDLPTELRETIQRCQLTSGTF